MITIVAYHVLRRICIKKRNGIIYNLGSEMVTFIFKGSTGRTIGDTNAKEFYHMLECCNPDIGKHQAQPKHLLKEKKLEGSGSGSGSGFFHGR